MRSVRITNDTGIATGTKIVDSETGEPIHGACLIQLKIVPCEPVMADITFGCAEVDMLARGTFRMKGPPEKYMLDPATGEIKNVKSIQFDDGTTWEA